MNNESARLLLVDDFPENLHTLSRILVGSYDLSVATSGADALAIAQETLPDLILLDVMMPQMDGLETLRRLRASDWGREIPVILVTADDRVETQVAGLEQGADDFIAKPIMAPVLMARVRNVLARQQVTRALARHGEYNALMRRMALVFIHLPLDRFDTEINAALARIGSFFHADRAYLFEYDHAAGITRNTHEWCAPGIEAQIDQLQNLPVAAIPEWVEPHQRGEALAIEDVAALPPGRLRDILEPQGICSLLTIPLMDEGACLGFVGLDTVARRDYFGHEERELLGLFAELAVSVFKRRDTGILLRKLSLAVEQSPESTFITDLDGNIEYVNASFSRQTGYSREEAIGNNPRILNSGTTPRATYEALWQALSQGRSWKGEFRNRHKNGDELINFAIITPLRQADGRFTHYFSVQEDVTEKKRLGKELDQHRHHLEMLVATRTAELAVAKDAAEAASRAKSAFLANMSHELRTPMNGVLGMIELARRRMADPSGLDQLGKAKLSAERLLGLLNDILDLSKIEAEHLVLEDTPLQLVDVVDHLLGVLGHKADEKGLRLAVDLPPALAGQPLKGDPLRLGQILLNLVGNAIKFTPSGEVILRVRAIDETSERVQVRFEISDTGIGIDADALRRLFQSFEQADNSMTRKYGGTGLGLAISKRLVQLMGGEVGVQSRAGAGSTFWFVVPLGKWAQVSPPSVPGLATCLAEQRLQTDYAGARVLLAEDEPVSQEVGRALLEDVGLSVDVAEDGRQALELTRQNRYALILMDMQMPNLNGVEATKAIRADSLNTATPILAMTANAFDEDREVCLAAGMSDHIAKPVDPDMFFDILLKWLSKEKPTP
jgi:PAS domain S-box-containing protein